MSSTRAAEAPPSGAGRRPSPAPPGAGGGLAGYPVPAPVGGLIRRPGGEPGRTGPRRTPGRVDKPLRFPTPGYAGSSREVSGDALFDERHHDSVIVNDIEMYSLCEHRILPFFGKVHIACIPGGRIPGLPRMARLAVLHARRPRVRERLAEQIAGKFREVVKPRGVGVVAGACHPCMMMRGAQKRISFTIASAVRGAFPEDARTRDEFLRLCEADRIPVG